MDIHQSQSYAPEGSEGWPVPDLTQAEATGVVVLLVIVLLGGSAILSLLAKRARQLNWRDEVISEKEKETPQ